MDIYMIVLWILQFALSIEGRVRKYDIRDDCNGTIIMSASGTNAIEILMYMTTDLRPRGRCLLHVDKHESTEYLHFYFSDIHMADCQDVSLHIYTGQSPLKLTSPYSDLPFVCGSSQEVKDHYWSDERNLLLDIKWSNTSVLGTVFRFIANIYTCDRDCTTSSQCDNDVCIGAELKSETNYNFCHESIRCTTANVKDDTDTDGILQAGQIVFVLVAFSIFSLISFCMFRRARSGFEGRHSGNCIGNVLECCCGALQSCFRGIRSALQSCFRGIRSALQSCFRGIRSCLRCVRERLVECYRRVKDSLDDCPCKRETPQTPQQTVMDTPTSPPTTVVIATQTETSTDDISPEYVYDNEVSDEEPEDGAPPSYTAAIAMPKSPTAPPSYQLSQDTPPDYQHVVANKSTFGISK